MTRSNIKVKTGQRLGDQKITESPTSGVVNYDTPRLSKFQPDEVSSIPPDSARSASRDLQLWQTNFACHEESTGSAYAASDLFIFTNNHNHPCLTATVDISQRWNRVTGHQVSNLGPGRVGSGHGSKL